MKITLSESFDTASSSAKSSVVNAAEVLSSANGLNKDGEYVGETHIASHRSYEVALKTPDGDNLYKINNSGLYAVDWKSEYQDPDRFETSDHVDALFREIQHQDVSDIYISELYPIIIKKNGDLYGITRRTIDRGEADFILLHITRASAVSELNGGKPVNSCFTMLDIDRTKKTKMGAPARVSFRVNASAITIAGRESFQVVMRAIPSEPLHYTKIGLDKEFVYSCCPTNGIVIIAGETGSGKTTTIASIIREILEGDTLIKGNILTHEEPIEFNYDSIFSKHSIINQSQIPENFKSFKDANREAMRRKPAAVLLGELRDEETIEAAVELALTGHPVYGTVHSTEVSTIIPRMVSRFPESAQIRACFDLIDCGRVFISQRLVKNIKTNRLFGVREYLYLSADLRVKLKSLGNPITINNEITRIMHESDGKGHASLSFAKQAAIFLQQGIINEDGYRRLTT